MPEVRRGSRTLSDTLIQGRKSISNTDTTSPPPSTEHQASPSQDTTTATNTTATTADDANTSNEASSPVRNTVSFAADRELAGAGERERPLDQPRSTSLPNPLGIGHSNSQHNQETTRKSLAYEQRPPAEAYYDSRAGTRREYRRRAKNLQEYYDDNPQLLPQLPFTWHHGWKRWRLIILCFFIFVDASAVPIALYYGLRYAGHVEGYIIFAVVTTIWGGPTYLEFGVRALRLAKKERFYRPLGTNSRWSQDMTTWTSALAIFVVTALFIIGSAPHNVWLRVLCMPAPAILWCFGGCVSIIQLYTHMGWKAPFRISSTGKGEPVLPGAYYFMEDVVAVNAGAGRPYREALAARYKASPRFRKMLYTQSWFWAFPALILAVPLTVIAIINEVPATGAYGVCWAVPFLWISLWGVITVFWCKKNMRRERLEWESDSGPGGVGGGSDDGLVGEKRRAQNEAAVLGENPNPTTTAPIPRDAGQAA